MDSSAQVCYGMIRINIFPGEKSMKSMATQLALMLRKGKQKTNMRLL